MLRLSSPKLTALIVLQLIGLSLGASTRGVHKTTVPAFLWSDKSYLGAHRVNYEATPSSDIIDGLLAGLTARREPKPNVVAAFIGQQLRSSHLGKHSIKGVHLSWMQPIQAALASANSSLVVPYTTFKKKSHHLGVTLQQGLQRAKVAGADLGEVAVVGDCNPHYEGTVHVESVEDLEAYLQARGATREPAATDVLLVCSSNPLNGDEALTSEVSTLDKVYSSILRTTSNYVAMYTSDPLHGSVRSYQRERLLLAADPAPPSNTTCNELCKTKANLLQTVGVALLLIVILISGLCCAFTIEGPTRFETADD